MLFSSVTHFNLYAGANAGRNIIIYSSYCKLHVRWLISLTPVTYWSRLLEIHCVAAFLQLELLIV
ncbi:hypothetical protein C2U51_22150 [Enterobacteriaceae bacterium ENNIH1]|nr:hypothetical protein C2U51_22150 [Enterobacteriaceae bacterium ENNIH1]